ncbi:MAG: CCA tRNA nucleotidyltransferase, partial [Vulcanococcus sp.]
MQLPGVPPALLQRLVAAAEGRRLALVGGAVRDLLLHRLHNDPWRGLPDLDLVVEGNAAEIAANRPPAAVLATALRRELGSEGVPVITEHGRFGTVAVELHLPEGGVWLLDLASARQEHYPAPAQNPVVRLGRLEDDLARRDFSVNAIALLLAADGRGVHLLDPHGGQPDLQARRLRLLHAGSLTDDPTRLLRAARYAARLGFDLDAASLDQAQSTLAAWPWPWRPGDPPGQAPPALGTRLRMELELLLQREPWRPALTVLQAWGGLSLLDAALQGDATWRRRLVWGQRAQLPAMAVLLAGAAQPLAVAERLQLPHREHKLLAQGLALRQRLAAASALPQSPSAWCALLEAPGLSPEAVALALAAGLQPRGPLLRWFLHWRHVKAPLDAAALM